MHEDLTVTVNFDFENKISNLLLTTKKKSVTLPLYIFIKLQFREMG